MTSNISRCISYNVLDDEYDILPCRWSWRPNISISSPGQVQYDPYDITVLLCSLQRHHNERDGVLNHRRLDCLPTVPKLRVTGLCVGNAPVTDEFPSQKASNTEHISIWWWSSSAEYICYILVTQLWYSNSCFGEQILYPDMYLWPIQTKVLNFSFLYHQSNFTKPNWSFITK